MKSSLTSLFTAVALVLQLLLWQSHGAATVPVPINLQCPALHSFDDTGLQCEECNSRKICGCPSTSLLVNVECSKDQMWQGKCEETSCSTRCHDDEMAVSCDQRACVPCSNTDQNSTYESSEYDAISSDCTCKNPTKGVPTRKRLATKKLVEIYDSSGLPIRKDCLRCPEGMAVITDDLIEDEQQFFVTAGRKYMADPYSCVSCPDPHHMFFDTDYSCVCIDGYFLTGEASVSEQSCIKNTPSVSTTSYSKVQFRDPFRLEASDDFTLESIFFSHLYIKAASECEFYSGSSGTGRRSCQALGNLCVLSMYDQDTPACKQLEAIYQRREESYHGVVGWKHTLPYLFYRDEPEYILNDRGINMRVSFHPEVDHVHVLQFKFAKYTMNGTFVGIEDVQNQFEFCAKDSLSVDNGRSHWSVFGLSYRVEHTCPISSLVGNEMFLYDMYLVDESADACKPESDCLYGVPVLIRNLVKDDKFPNVNQRLGDDIDDVYTRRFFLFDNKSGQTSSGIEAVRYAKKIVLQIQIQSEQTRLYPPKLTIEYATATKGSWPSEEEISSVFQVEYSMKTDKFWESIQIMIGFLCAFGVAIFGIRLNNWQSRQRASDDGSAGSIFGLSLVLHAFMVASHTFVVLLFFFIFMICLYWFVFFKLQNEVYILLPPKDEFIFFELSFRSLFWCQTIHMAYVIVKQCMSDIIFVDWECLRGGNSGNGVSMWRLATVANHFNKMQSRRRSNIEFSLIFVGFVMIGLRQNQNAFPYPNFHYNNSENNGNIALEFANTVLFWIAAAIIQWLWRFIVYERFLDEPPSTKFVDLCTMCNISVFMMVENHKGYYLHGKSPYESADCSMEELLKNLNREGRGTTTTRGLVGATGGCQIFTFYASPVFRRQISKIYSYARPGQEHRFYQSNNDAEKNHLARAEVTVFLQSFINRQPSPSRDGLSYVVRESWLAERLLSVTPAEFRTKSEPKCIMYQDDNGFLSTTFLDLGIEIDLLIHDILTYNAASMAFNNVGVSIFLTYLMHLLRTNLRSWFGKRNLSDKSLIDPRFFE